MARKGTLPLITDFDNIPDEALVPVEEQPYPIPEHWKWVRLGAICELNPPKPTFNLPNEAPVAFVPMAAVSEISGSITKVQRRNYSSVSKGYTCFAQGDVLFAKITPCMENGKSAIVPNLESEAGFGSTEFFVLRPSNLLNPKLLHQLLRQVSFRLVAKQAMTGAVGQQRVPKAFLTAFPIPLPPKDEQLRIVEKLDAHLAQTNSAIAEAERFLAGFESYRNGLIQAGVSGQLTAQWRAQNGIKREDWVTHNLRELGKWGGGGTPRKSNPDFWENGTIPWVTPKDVKSWILNDTQDHVTQEGISGSTTNLYIGPAIAFVVRSGILRRTLPTTIVEGSFTANQDMKILHNISEDFDVRFIHHLVRSKEAGIRSSCAKSGTTVESIDFQKLLDFKLRLPLIAEQKEIVRLVESKLENLKQAEALAQESLTKLNALRDSLVSAALSGRLT